MINKRQVFLLLLIVFTVPCFAGGLKGNLISDEMIAQFWAYVILVHLFSVFAYFMRVLWLRVICGIVYLPIFLIPLVLSFFNPAFCLLFVPPIAFYIFFITKRRKVNENQA